ncbi:hypothetical protein L7H23_01295 [Sphingopyxis sp. BSN-002]|uniref:hypothetical protein n=1 Tax=Sphingopyxis sp. BSN-002 TaxID=2911495 RepID=UPI001EDAE453|nr:hypothetical protein [Sphingopyxis sp. BSN-002]QVJ07686.1 hypothetical protein [Sphingopyxis phage VSN-002]UKK84768.1 hypothetical protein L7H23_01295 [Sphingopyxis sp. BSN-002]
MDKQDESLMERDPLALAMFAAWCNLPADKLPAEMRAHTCPATAEAWGRVAAAVRAYMESPDVVERVASAIVDSQCGVAWSKLSDRDQSLERSTARAALSAATGGDRG